MIKIGFSKDVHPLKENEKLILGGIEIPHYKGSVGYSDADCLLHAIAEAMLGALALGDLGKFFPDDDPRYKDYDSKLILKEVFDYISSKGYEISNIDTMVSLEKPKIRNYIKDMRECIADILNCDIKLVSIKATTFEGLGFVGREEGIICEAVVVLEKSDYMLD
ncbi:MAG: 2-C-methyl-D-erythritol 2,4-cyclodiphosphate synthase [Candidatus Izemoplasmatales bacterium]|mgnify:CR=1 FL=1|jgi:2-C-methyl-D-erythritol 2,4-cyclodiphosphate synthase|nr:2-C-methyl-D-erythritol 2,4-cyclodiphosphate synthase [Candidatus Izemoplasmatales bacterium]MDY0011020.1 2-C-methyl-D-erythritol 2,4-cyclodiphosphate synthase [Candidatus Izemoplasmatales bacterium]